MIETNAYRLKERQEEETYPLELQAYRDKMDGLQSESKEFRGLFTKIEGLAVGSPAVDSSFIQADSVRIARYERWHSELSKDVYVNEVMHILRDMTLAHP